jgi:signal transduction histidine kinase/CheY-like chemotaxis protein
MVDNAIGEVSTLTIHLRELRSISFSRIVILLDAICYIALIWALWPTNNGSVRMSVAAISVVVVVVSTVAQYVQRLFIEFASICLIGSIVGAIGLLTRSLQSADTAYLFVVPVIFAGVLLGQTGTGLVALSCAAIMVMSTGTDMTLHSFLFPLLMLALATGAVMVSTSNLYTALTWALNGYDAALRNQNIARDQTGRLEQALKSLDIAVHNLFRLNHALDMARAQAEEARRMKQDFAQIISHELRTPLNLVVGFTEAMIQSPEYYGQPLSPVYLRDLSIVYRNASHLRDLVNDVLDLARVDTAQMSLSMEPTKLTEIAVEAADTARSLVETRGLTFYSNIDSDLPTAWVDPIRIKQIIFNLLNNAAKYTDQGSVTFSALRRGEEVIFEVADSGIGIAPENIKNIFEPFRQVGDPLRRRAGGVGLGLTISQQMARLHGGQIQVESQPGVGSTFTFNLPLNVGETLTHEHIDLPAYSVSRKHTEEDIVLLVTRSPAAASTVSRFLRTCRTIVVQNVEQAERASRQMLPQVIVVDTTDNLIDVNALSVNVAAWGVEPVCIITCPLPGTRRLGGLLAADAYLTKPISHGDLWDTLRQFGELVYEVLVVDDDQDFLHLMQRMLKSPLMRYNVSTVRGGREALEMMHHHPPDLVLLDLDMPDMDGFEFLEHLRSNPKWQAVRVIIVSGQDSWNMSELLTGSMTVTRPIGMTPSEALKWLQSLIADVTGV